MQWLLFAALLVVMAFLQRLTRTGPLEARATLALGFLLLAAYVAGELARRFRQPRIVGYLIAGLVVGPTWLKLVRADELLALNIVSNGALALIAFAAGNFVGIAELRGQRSAILRILAAAMVLPFLVVAFVVLSVSPWFPLTVHQPFRDALAVALLLGAMAAASSSVVAWPIHSETGTKGPLSATIIRISVIQDMALALLIALLLLIAQPLASSGAVTPEIGLTTLLRLGGSIAAGVVLGLGITQYARAVRTHIVWVLVAAAFVVAQGERLLGLEPVLMGLAAGCTAANLDAEEASEIRGALERCTLPLHVVFFALLGCALRFEGLSELWPWILLLAGLRFVSLRAGMRWAGRNPAVDAELVTYGWLGLVPQGGLAFTLALVLRRAFPEWGITLESLLMAAIGVHLIAGPICYYWALRRMGEAPEGVHGANNVGSVDSGVALVPGGGGV